MRRVTRSPSANGEVSSTRPTHNFRLCLKTANSIKMAANQQLKQYRNSEHILNPMWCRFYMF